MGCCGWKHTNRVPTVPAAPAPGLRVVERHRATAETELTAATGGAPLCHLDGAPDAKRAEGALAAVAELHRTARRSPQVDPLGEARVLLNRWIDARATAADMGPAWRAYRDGGVTELVSVIADLERAATPSPPG